MIERRTTTATVGVETRANGSKAIVGYGSVFYNAADPGTEFELWKGAVERVAPTAFDEALRRKDDARGLFNHDSNMLLGRVGAGTMRLSVDSKGLRYEIDSPDTQVGRDVVASIERGDLAGSSFAFVVDKVSWEARDGLEIRTIESVTLYDVGPVTYPSYAATTTGLRSAAAEEVRREREAWRRDLDRMANARRAVDARLRSISLT